MKKIIAFAGSNSSTSINRQLVEIAAKMIENANVELLDLRDYPAPMYGIDLEKSDGIPQTMQTLKEKFESCDGFLISSPEHNGSMPAFFKNTIDWLSRIKNGTSTFGEKPVLLMSSSPGKRGGQSNHENLQQLMPFWGGKIVSTFRQGEFYQNVSDGELSEPYKSELAEAIQLFAASLE